MKHAPFASYVNGNAGTIDVRYITYSEWILRNWHDPNDYDDNRVREHYIKKYGKEVKIDETEGEGDTE